MGNLKEIIDACLEDTSYEEGRKSVKNETWEYAGEGAVRAVDYLLQKYEEISQNSKTK